MAYFQKKNSYLYKKKKEGEAPREKNKYSRNYVTTIAITELRRGIGCTHIARGLHNFLDSSEVIASEMEEEGALENDVDTRIYDLGDYYCLEKWKEKEFQKADIRLVVVTYDMDNISDLMEFAQEFEDSCIYLFNFVPKEAQKDVNDMMEDYTAYCLPLFLVDKPNKEIKKIFKEIIR